ncbi:hypothetical protein G5V59_25175 [Nocardioides sp. W3-2-3]|nr:hypothetical protein [Nocardioides convexus]
MGRDRRCRRPRARGVPRPQDSPATTRRPSPAATSATTSRSPSRPAAPRRRPSSTTWTRRSRPTTGSRSRASASRTATRLDQATADGKYIANIYQHKHWLKQVTDSTGMKSTALGPVFQWSYSVYSTKYSSLDDLPKGATIALLNDPANTAQALWILERAGKA